MNELEQLIKKLENYEDPDLVVYHIMKNCLKLYNELTLAQKGEMFFQIGDLLQEKSSNFALSLDSYEYAVNYFIRTNDREAESDCYTNLGVAHNRLGNFRKAIEYHEKSLEIAQEIQDRDRESACYANLGVAHNRLGNFRKAIEYHEKSLEIVRK